MNQVVKKMSGGRSIIESLVIVVSILLAFAIEAWWAEQLENITEGKELDRLHIEFIANRDRINRSITGQEIAREATDELYTIIKDVISPEPIPLPNNLLQAMLFTPTFDVATPVLDSLVLSGNLSVIEDPDVLRAISVWQRTLTQVNESETGARSFTNSMVFPNLIKRGNIGPLLIVEEKADQPGNDSPQNRRPPEPTNTRQESEPNGTQNGPRNGAASFATRLGRRFSDTGETLISVDDEFKGIIAKRITEAGRSAQTLNGLEEAADQLINTIESARE